MSEGFSHKGPFEIAFFGLIAFILSATLGSYCFEYVLLFTVTLLAFTLNKNSRLNRPQFLKDLRLPHIVSILLILSLWRVWHRPLVLYVENTDLAFWQRGILLLGALSGSALLIRPIFETRRFWFFLGVCFSSLFLAKLLIVFVSPCPKIDVFVFGELAIDFLRNGLSPYSQKYPDIYAGTMDYIPRFVYPPGVLYLTGPFKWLFGDHRFAYIGSDLVATFCIYKLCRKYNGDPKTALLVCLLWFSFPVGLLSIEQAWVDSLLFAFIGLLSLALANKRYLLAGVLLGIIISTKQYGFILAIPVLVNGQAQAGKNRAIIVASLAVSFAFLICFPFVIWDPQGFQQSVVFDLLQHPLRTDAFSFLTLLQVQFGVVLSGPFSLSLKAESHLQEASCARGASTPYKTGQRCFSRPDANGLSGALKLGIGSQSNNLAPQEEMAALQALIDTPYFSDLGIQYQIRVRVLETLLQFYKLHMEGFGTIRSVEVLHTIFH
jgi:hypothetical protein